MKSRGEVLALVCASPIVGNTENAERVLIVYLRKAPLHLTASGYPDDYPWAYRLTLATIIKFLLNITFSFPSEGVLLPRAENYCFCAI